VSEILYVCVLGGSCAVLHKVYYFINLSAYRTIAVNKWYYSANFDFLSAFFSLCFCQYFFSHIRVVLWLWNVAWAPKSQKYYDSIFLERPLSSHFALFVGTMRGIFKGCLRVPHVCIWLLSGLWRCLKVILYTHAAKISASVDGGLEWLH
jgi:hypothetical protein